MTAIAPALRISETVLGLLPPALRAQVAEANTWCAPEVAAGICVRWACTTNDGLQHPVAVEALGWWRALSAEMREATVAHASCAAAQLALAVEPLGGGITHEEFENLATWRDRVACADELFFVTGVAESHSAILGEADKVLRALWWAHEAHSQRRAFADPVLALWARRLPGCWWLVAPGAEWPPLDADAWRALDQQELDLFDDLDAEAERDAEGG